MNRLSQRFSKGYKADDNEKRDKKWTQRQEIFMQRTRCKNSRNSRSVLKTFYVSRISI